MGSGVSCKQGQRQREASATSYKLGGSPASLIRQKVMTSVLSRGEYRKGRSVSESLPSATAPGPVGGCSGEGDDALRVVE